MMSVKYGLALMLAIISCLVASAQSREGGATLHYLSLPATTKTATLGGVTASIIANDAALALESPALFGLEQDGQLSLSYMNYLSDTHVGSVFYARQLDSRGAWGVGGRYIDYGRQEERKVPRLIASEVTKHTLKLIESNLSTLSLCPSDTYLLRLSLSTLGRASRSNNTKSTTT